jgi:anti-anti-sigma factor
LAADLIITTSRCDRCVVVAVAGEVDTTTSGRFRAVLAGEFDAGCTRLVLDLGALTFLDSSGLATLIQAHRHTVANGGWVRLAGPHGTVFRVLNLTGLAGHLPVYPTVHTALATPPDPA